MKKAGLIMMIALFSCVSAQDRPDPGRLNRSAGQSLQLSFKIEDEVRGRDQEMQPERLREAIGVRPGMIVGEAGVWYGYYTFKLSRWVGPAGCVYANDINSAALRTIEERCVAEGAANIKTVLGVEDDPRFPRSDLDLILVGDCLHMFSRPAEWMAKARRYLKPGGRLIIVDPDSSKMTASIGFLSKPRVRGLGAAAGYEVVDANDGFLRRHMIVILRTVAAR
jgi:SAM-dependent methyltransferase